MHPILRRAVLPAVLAALFAASPVAMPLVLAAQLVPFTATFTEQDAFGLCSPPSSTSICATATGTGQASQLGNATEAVNATIICGNDCRTLQPPPGCFPDQSTGTLTAANGDQIFVTAVGRLCPPAGIDSGRYQVTGGTGPFARASGRGTFITHVLSPTTSQTTYIGTLSFPGSSIV